MRGHAWPVAVACAAAAYLYLCGSRRFELGMQYAYVGGYEVFLGHRPYREFHMIVGPVLFLLQGLFFKLLGVSYAAGFLTHAAVFNGLAAWMAYAIAARGTSGRLAPVAAGLLTGIWFYPIYHAHPWYDQESFFFILAAVFLTYRRRDRRGARLLLAGICAALAFFTKQSSGALGIVLLGFALGSRDAKAPGWKRALNAMGGVEYLVGVAAGLAALGGLCVHWGGLSFFHHFLVRPLQAGRLWFIRRADFWLLGAACFLALWRWRPLPERSWFIAAGGLALAAVVFTSPLYLVFLVPAAFLPLLPEEEDRALVAALCLIQLGSRIASVNEIKIFWPFLGLLFALALDAARSSEARCPGLGTPLKSLAFLGPLTFAFLGLLGWRLSYYHGIVPIVPGVTILVAASLLAAAAGFFRRRLAAVSAALALAGVACGARAVVQYERRKAALGGLPPEARRLATARVSIPQLRGVAMPQDLALSLERIVPYLSQRGPSFCYPECSMLSTLAGRPLTEPELWLDPGLTFKKDDGTESDVLAAMERKGVRTVVLASAGPEAADGPSFEEGLLADLPKIRRRLKEKGRLALTTPLFRVYELSP